ncbi:MAG TPA: GcrA family cell cycle regulator [Caulobacteraceae bacterium]|nr:GcrA family cell cycle regulator [Caulobacteraceae bacterium]
MSPSALPALGWSDDRVTTLSQLWREGLSASQIARQLGGVTRNAVIGKIHRLGLSGRGAPSAPARAPRVAAPRARRPARAAPPVSRPLQPPVCVSLAPPEGPGLVDTLVRLGAHACKWPIGDPKCADFSFCGRPTDGRYCEAHERLGVRPGTASRLDRDPVVRRALAGLI